MDALHPDYALLYYLISTSKNTATYQFFKSVRCYTKMRVLTEADFQAELEPILRQVFSTDDPFGQPFTANIPARRIIHEYSYQVESPLLEAIVDAASSIGDSGFYFSTLWRPKDEITEEAYHWYIPFEHISRQSPFSA